MRPALLPGLIEALRRNADRQQERVRLFEVGRVFAAGADAPLETLRMAAAATGAARPEQWSEASRSVDFYDLKGDLESLAALAGHQQPLSYRPAVAAWLHPGRSAEVWRGEKHLGLVGHLHPGLLKLLGLDHDVVVFELDLDPLRQRALPAATALSRFPSVRRDLALVVPESVAWHELEVCVRETLGQLLSDVVVFDRYVGPGLETGFKSIAMGLILQDVSRTLVDQEVEERVQAVLEALATRCKARLRG
jgi:phenylalanyl-tRNA synthetase beta chain